MEHGNHILSWGIRLVCWIFNVLGHFFLFLPIINLLSWIPFIGALLSMVVALAAFIFALIWGTLIQIIVMLLSWLVYRPLISIIGLTLIAVGIVALNVVIPS